ncbi:hypothetical protein F511_16170 [Dorcoceras hygrometricum]|uniref:Dystroglycan-like n=1 Tax=Dorcoceras hygrometricum TaxID=472368 RepID=A0A2Z7CGH0_9LAMI|nr:hypothetical protein F511_16170 [Dorcoceras hygrometricum]
MASAYYSNTVHIDFASVLAMENPGIELVDFFNNGSVRDGLVVSTVNGVPVEFSEQLFAETFELPVDGLADLSDMPKDKIFDARSIVSLSGEPVNLIAKWDAEKKVTTPSDTDEEIEAGRASEPIDRGQTEVSQPAYLVEKSADMEKSTADQSVDEFIDIDEARSLEDIILSIPADIPLPSAVLIEYSLFSSLLSTIDFSSLRSVVITDRGIDLHFGSNVQRLYVLLTELDDQDVQIESSSIFESQDVQIKQDTGPVTPLVQLTLDQHQSSPTSFEDTSMGFDDTDIAATAPTFSQPGSSIVSPDITEAIHQMRTSLDQISNRDAGAALKDIILMHLHDIEKKFTARFDTQDRWLGALRNDSNNQRNLLSLEIKSSQRQLNTQITTVAIDQIDMRREVKELNAKVDAMATNLEILRRDAEATKEAISHQLSFLVYYINRGGDTKKGEGSSSRPQPPPSNVQGQGSGGNPGEGSGPTAVRLTDIADRILEDDRRQMEAERERERQIRIRRLSGSSKRRRY